MLNAADRPTVPLDPALRQLPDDGLPLLRAAEAVNRKRFRRLMAVMGPEPLSPLAADDHRGGGRTGLSVPAPGPGERIRVNEVWSSDNTHAPTRHKPMSLKAVIDWFSRSLLSRPHSNMLEGRCCLEALDEALSRGRPEIFNVVRREASPTVAR